MENIKIGDVLKLGVKRFGRDGDPIVIHNRMIIFIKDTNKVGVEINKMIDIKITKVFPNYAFAEINKK